MADLVLQSQNILSADIPQINFDEGIVKNLDDIARSREKIAAQYQKKSENIFANKFETQTRETVNKIYNESPDDPDLVKKKIDEYADGVFKDIPFDQRSDFRKAYVAITNPLITKAFDNKNRILTNELFVSTEQNRDQILMDIQRDSENVLVPDPRLSEDERLIQQTESLEALETNFQALNISLSRVGPDGKPLYSAKEQIRIISNAKEVMLSTASKSWLDQQPNKLKALREWSSGALSIPVFDGEKIVNVPVKHAFNPAIVNKVEKELIARARNELSISDKMEKHNERINKRISNEVANTLYSSSYTGDLDVNDVDQWRTRLEPKDFRTLKKMAIAKDVVTEGVTYNRLALEALDGNDVTEAAITALEGGLLNVQDVVTLRNMSAKDQRGFSTPVAEAQKTLSGILSTVSTSIKGEDLALQSAASRELKDALEDFQDVNNREPSRREANEIATEVAEPYLNRQISKTLLKAPIYGPGKRFKYDRKSLTVDNVNESRKETVIFFRDKWPGNPEAAKSDIRFLEQMRLLEKWEVLASKNETRLARIAERQARKR